MIHGTGVDIVDIERFGRSIERYGDRFLTRIFSDCEIEYCSRQFKCAQHFAARFAAKEAVLKSLGRGLGQGVSMRGIVVVRDDMGRPTVRLEGRMADLADALGVKRLHISLSHGHTHCVAMAIAERDRAPSPINPD